MVHDKLLGFERRILVLHQIRRADQVDAAQRFDGFQSLDEAERGVVFQRDHVTPISPIFEESPYGVGQKAVGPPASDVVLEA